MNTATRTHVRSCLAITLACALPIAVAAEPGMQAEPDRQAQAPAMSAEQQAMMDAWTKAGTPGAEHARLAEHFVGTWNVAMTFWMDPDAPPMTESGTATTTAMFGGRQLRQDFKGTFMGAPFEGTGMSGYDNVRKRYTSSWADNMSTSTMLTYGDYDAATNTYTFKGEMADPMKAGAMIPVRETVQVIDADHHVMEMFEPKDGKEVRTMRLEYTRVK
jgi:hypothetical protein